jgi:hypothetical protein
MGRTALRPPILPECIHESTDKCGQKKLLKKLEKDGEDVLYILIGFDTMEELPDTSLTESCCGSLQPRRPARTTKRNSVL